MVFGFFKAMSVHVEINILLKGYEHWFAGAVPCMTAVIQEAAGTACYLSFSDEYPKQL